MLLLVLLMLCICIIINAQYVIYQEYSASGCTGSVIYTAGFTNNFCIYDGDSDSRIYTCSNNTVTEYKYASSTVCTLIPTSTYTFPTTCLG